MTITDVKVRLLTENDKLKAVASVTFDECFVIHDIKVIGISDSLFISMPSRKGKDGQFKDIAHPINPEARDMIEKAILDAYNKEGDQ